MWFCSKLGMINAHKEAKSIFSLSIHYNLPHMIMALAPMEDVTDTVFRQIVASVGRPDLFFTEFANVDAILHGDVQRLKFSEVERPIIAQIWGSDPEKFARVAEMINNLGFDGVDINTGCPQKKIIKAGGCSALIGQNTLMSEIISATKQAGLPVSVKTRLGKKVVEPKWFEFLLDQKLSMLTVHGRTVSEMSRGLANWDEIKKIVEMRGGSKTLIIGNGDVKSVQEAKVKSQKYGVDGVMIGRGIFENPAVFNAKGLMLNTQEKIRLFINHVELFEKTWGSSKNFAILKKFSKTYINGFEGAPVIRQKVAGARNYEDLIRILNSLP